MDSQKGFTLVEVLISTVIIFLLFSLIYMTFFSVSRLSVELQKNMKSSEILMKFLHQFYKEGKSFVTERDSDYIFQQKEVVFKYIDEKTFYPSLVKYCVQLTEKGEILIRQQTNLLTGYVFTIPILEECENIDFLFYDGQTWNYDVQEEEKLVALAIEVQHAGEKIFYPVALPVNGKNAKKQ